MLRVPGFGDAENAAAVRCLAAWEGEAKGQEASVVPVESAALMWRAAHFFQVIGRGDLWGRRKGEHWKGDLWSVWRDADM